MGYSDDIRTIAKTKEIEEKLAKLKDASDAQKAIIGASRATATQTGDNSKGIQTGAPGGDTPINATLPTGAQQSTPPNGTPNQGNSNSTSTGGSGGSGGGGSDSLSAQDVANAVDRMNGGGGAGGKTDLSGSASTGNNPGGSDALHIGQGGAGDTVLSALIAKAQADGQPTQTIQKMIDTYLAAKFPVKGNKTAKEFADDANTTPQTTYSSPQEIKYPGQGLGKEVTDSIIGFVQDGAVSAATGKMLVVKAQLRGVYPTPSDADATAAGQGTWLSPSEPPLLPTFTMGRSWVLLSGIVKVVGQTFQSMVSQREALTGSQCYSYVGLLITSVTPAPGDNIQFGAPGHIVGDSTGSVGGTQYTQQTYAAGVSIGAGKYGQQDYGLAGEVGPQPEAREIAWPSTGVFVMLALNGVFGGNPFDLERPFIYDYDTSRIRMKVGDGDTVIDDRYLDLEVAAKGGYLISTWGADGVTMEANSGKYLDSDGAVLFTGLSAADMQAFRPRY